MSAPSGIKWGEVVGTSPHQGKIGIYVKLTETATEVTRHTEIWFASKYSVSDTSNTFYYNDNASSATTSKGAVSIKTTVSTGSGWSSTNEVKIAEYDYTFTKGTSASTRSVAAKLTGIDIIGASKTMTAVNSYKIPALATYTVQYDANGGTGAPGNQTKTYGKTLTLSSTTPTRTGYTFKGWATSSSGSVVYVSGASYTKNAVVTLYAVWEIKTYSVKYDANGGSGAPPTQTKTYGKTLTLSNTKPKRTGYTFKGWATSSSGSVAYASGASYTSNSAVTLYAVWEIITYTVTYNANGGTLGSVKTQTKNYGETLKLTGTATRSNYTFKGWAISKSGSVVYNTGSNYAVDDDVTLYAVWTSSYAKPKITNFTVARCNSSGTTTDSGTYARVKFNWSTSVAATSALIEWKQASKSVTSWSNKTVTLSGTSGSVNQIVGSNAISTSYSYTVRVTVKDSGGSSILTKTLPSLMLPIDFLKGGTGTAIGKTAELAEYLDVGYTGKFHKNVYVGQKSAHEDGNQGVALNKDGYIHLQRDTSQGYHPYLGFYLGNSTSISGQVRVNSSTKLMEFLSAVGYTFGNTVYLPNNIHIEGTTTDGNTCGLIYLNTNNNTIVGYGGYEKGYGTTNIYGNKVHLGVRAGGKGGAEVFYRPYYDKGDSITVTWTGGGYVSNSKANIYFTIPLAKPVIGNPTVTVASSGGIRLRQNEKYTHGSSADNYTKNTISSYSATLVEGNHVQISVTMNDTTNAVNNDTTGVQWSGTITFE